MACPWKPFLWLTLKESYTWLISCPRICEIELLSFYEATKKSDHLPRSIFNVPLRPDAPTSLSCIDVSFPLHQAMREILNVWKGLSKSEWLRPRPIYCCGRDEVGHRRSMMRWHLNQIFQHPVRASIEPGRCSLMCENCIQGFGRERGRTVWYPCVYSREWEISRVFEKLRA